MPEVLFAVSAINLLLFAALGWTAVKQARSDLSPRLRALGWVAAAAAGAFVLGAGQRMALQATRAGWLSTRVTDFLLSDWQLAQSLTAMALGVLAMAALARVWGPLGGPTGWSAFSPIGSRPRSCLSTISPTGNGR